MKKYKMITGFPIMDKLMEQGIPKGKITMLFGESKPPLRVIIEDKFGKLK